MGSASCRGRAEGRGGGGGRRRSHRRDSTVQAASPGAIRRALSTHHNVHSRALPELLEQLQRGRAGGSGRSGWAQRAESSERRQQRATAGLPGSVTGASGVCTGTRAHLVRGVEAGRAAAHDAEVRAWRRRRRRRKAAHPRHRAAGARQRAEQGPRCAWQHGARGEGCPAAGLGSETCREGPLRLSQQVGRQQEARRQKQPVRWGDQASQKSGLAVAERSGRVAT